MTFASYFARVVSWFLALVALPVWWWLHPRSLLAVIHVNTECIGWVIRQGVEHIPNPQIQRYVRYGLKPGEWFQWGLQKALTQVPLEYRDHVEVLARLRYDPGAWMVVGEVAAVLFLTWLVLRWSKRRRELVKFKRNFHSRKEPSF